MKHHERLSRRRFLGEASCAGIGSISVLSTLLNLKLAGRLVAQGTPPDDGRTLVCLFLNGGQDSFNMLVPRGAEYAEYAAARSNLAIPEADLLPLNPAVPVPGRSFGLHPSCREFQELFNGLGGVASRRRLAFVANIGTLIRPVTLAEYQAETQPLPKALFSHSDQIDQWQTSVPQGMAELSGWAGRAADLIHATQNTGTVSMSLSLSGNNVFQTGRDVGQFVITPDGSLTFNGPDTSTDTGNPLYQKNRALRGFAERRYTNLLEDTFAQITKRSLDSQRAFQGSFDRFGTDRIRTPFPQSYLARQLQAIARIIAIRRDLGLRRQTFFAQYGGWDHHSELLNTHRNMLGVLSQAVGAFQKALDELGLQDQVVTFIGTEFGRTLRSNGRGTDHAWGGNAMVLGGPVQGGRIFGRYPSLALDGPDDVGLGGRILPTTSIDSFYFEMLRWFGVAGTDMPYVLPNIRNFLDPMTNTPPLGFLRTT
jgi:uncharacterized protein (DUF1501 family)